MKIGNYTIPELRIFPTLYESVKLIYETYKLDEAEMETIANLLGHKSTKSGALHRKLADMRSYGLIEARSIKATKLSEMLTYGTADEQQEAKNEAILNIPLWKELYREFKENPPEENFWVHIKKITGAIPLDAQTNAETIRDAYLKDIQHVKFESKKAVEQIVNIPQKQIEVQDSSIYIQAGSYNQTLPYTEEGIELGKGFLDMVLKLIKAKSDKK